MIVIDLIDHRHLPFRPCAHRLSLFTNARIGSLRVCMPSDSRILSNLYGLAAFLEDDVFRAERRVTGQALDHFSSTVPPFLGADPRRRQPPGIDVDLFTIHAMINVAYIYLQRDHLGKCMPASKLCLKAAHTVSSHIRQLKEEDYPFLHPIIGVCCHALIKAVFLVLTSFRIRPAGKRWACYTPVLLLQTPKAASVRMNCRVSRGSWVW